MRYSVVVPTFQRRSLVLAAVRSLSCQEFDGEYEVIVVVDGSSDGSAEALRSLAVDVRLTIIEQVNQGLSAARNVGAAAARGDLLLFLDDDMEADHRLLHEHDSSHTDRPALVLGHIPAHPDSPANFLSAAVAAWAQERRERLDRPGVSPELKDCVMGQSSIPRTVFLDLGGFDRGFTRSGSYGNEDLEFCYRLSKAGIPIIFNSRAVSWQRYVVSARAHLDQWQDSGRADVQFARKHPELIDQIFERSNERRLQFGILYGLFRRLCLAIIRLGFTGSYSQGFYFHVRRLAHAEGVRRAGGIPQRGVLQILCYHSIADLDGTVLGPYGVAPECFRQQLSTLLRRGYQFVTAAEFLRYLNQGVGLPRKALLLTFDDCYKNLYKSGLPILKELGIPGLAFVVSQRIGAANDWDAHLGGPVLRLASRSELKALAHAGVALAAHSRSHPDLTRLSAGDLHLEVSKPIAELKTEGLEPLLVFAYPYGEHDQRIRNAVQMAGYQAAVSTELGLVTPSSNRYRLPRIEVMSGDSIFRLRSRLFRNRCVERVRGWLKRREPNEPCVTIVVPAYNAETTLPETLGSIRAQTFALWEAIVVDDGSTDATARVGAEWCRADKRFRLLRRENGGEGAARNTGLAAANTDWLVFLDADDWIVPEYLQCMMKAASWNKDLDGIVCGCVRVTPSGLFSEPAIYLPGDLDDSFPQFVRDCPLAIHNCVIRRSVADAVGGFDETLKTCADWDFWQRVARCGSRLGTVADILALYRMRRGSASTLASSVLADGFAVIRRGYGADPRLQGLAGQRYPFGLDTNDLSQTLYRHALWPASMLIVMAKERTDFVDALAEIGNVPLKADSVANELFHNIPLAAAEVLEAWPELLPALSDSLSEFLAELESMSGLPGLAKEVSRVLEQRILEVAEFDYDLTVGKSYGVRIDVSKPVPQILSPVDAVHTVLVVFSSGKKIGLVAARSNHNLIPPETAAALIVSQLSWPLMRNHLGLRLPRGSGLASQLRLLSLESWPLPVLLAFCRSIVPLLRWQRSAGALRNRRTARDLLRLLVQLRPLALAWRLRKAGREARWATCRSALAEASERCVLAQFPELDLRS